MFRFVWTCLIVTLVATATGTAASATCFLTDINGWYVSRDKKGTSGGQEKEDGSQVAVVSALTSRFSLTAEGTGVEPATGFPASDFESRNRFL